MSFDSPSDTLNDKEVCEYLNMSTEYGMADFVRFVWKQGYDWGWQCGYEDKESECPREQKVEIKINELIALTLLSAIQYRTVEDMFNFCEICDDYGFEITGDIDFYGLYNDEQEKLFKEWHIKANEMFLKARKELLEMLCNS